MQKENLNLFSLMNTDIYVDKIPKSTLRKMDKLKEELKKCAENTTMYDSFFQQEKIIFYPFVGKEYHSQPKKILIVGENHYENDMQLRSVYNDKENKYRYTTTRYDLECLDKNKGMKKYYQRMQKMIGIEWDAVSFYHAIQKVSRIGQSAKRDQFFEYKREFFTVLKILKPDYVFCFSKKIFSDIQKYSEIYDVIENIEESRILGNNIGLYTSYQYLEKTLHMYGISNPMGPYAGAPYMSKVREEIDNIEF